MAGPISPLREPSPLNTKNLVVEWMHNLLTIFLPVMTFVICSLICLCSEVAFIVNDMDTDQTASLVCPDMDPNCLQRLWADDKNRI